MPGTHTCAEEIRRLEAELSVERAARRESEKRLSLLQNVFESCRDPIYVRSKSGRFLFANQASFDLVGMERPQNETPLEYRPFQSYFPRKVADRLEAVGREVILEREARSAMMAPLRGRLLEMTMSPFYDERGDIKGVVGVAHDVTQRRRQAQLISVLHKGITDYQALMSGKRLWDFLLRALWELTDSEYGLIGEVIEQRCEPALKVHAITGFSRNGASGQLMDQLQDNDMILTHPEGPLGRVFALGETVLIKNQDGPTVLEELPPGLSELNNYLGVPIHDGKRLIGMYAIANSRHGYDQSLLDWLEPFTATCALLINLYRQFALREKVMEELACARDQAERASQAKSEFLSSMSHELRTPLNAILGFAQLLGNGRKEPLSERQRRQVHHIDTSGRHLLSLINEVLDLSRIEAGQLQLSLEDIELAMVIEDARGTLASMAEAAQVSLQVAPIETGTRVTADRTRLKQVLFNLLSNAIKYNRRPGCVEIRCRPEDDYWWVTVSDSGHGIPESRLGELFQPFNRLGAEQGPIEGTGIGLSLTKKLVESMRGRIGVDSCPAEGSEFWFELPMAGRHVGVLPEKSSILSAQDNKKNDASAA